MRRTRSWQASQASAKALKRHEAAAWQYEIFPVRTVTEAKNFPRTPESLLFFVLPTTRPAPRCARPCSVCISNQFSPTKCWRSWGLTPHHIPDMVTLGMRPAHQGTTNHTTPCGRQLTERRSQARMDGGAETIIAQIAVGVHDPASKNQAL